MYDSHQRSCLETTSLDQDHQVDGGPVLQLLIINLSNALTNLSASKLKNVND